MKRAELQAMHMEEVSLRNFLIWLREYKASVILQANLRCYIARKKYCLYIKKRLNAALYIQEMYRQRLYYIAMRLPYWCVVGGEVLVAKSAARRAGTIINIIMLF